MKSNNRCSWLQLFALAFFALAISEQSAAISYTITDLGTLPGSTDSIGYGLNDYGQVAGYSTSVSGSYAFRYSGGQIQAVGSLNGETNMARGINNSGYVVGGSNPGGTIQRAFIYDGATMQDLGVGNYSWAGDINNSGYIVGYAAPDRNTPYRAFLFAGGTKYDLGAGNYSSATGINDGGQIIGVTGTTTIQRSFLYQNGVLTYLDSMGFQQMQAVAISNTGYATGVLYGSTGPYRAFLYDGQAVNVLGTLGGDYSDGYGVNDRGHVVGVSRKAGGTQRAFYYDGTTMLDLNNLIAPGSGWELVGASAINSSDQITGWGIINGSTHAYLMTPTSVVPVPAAFWLFGSGLVGLFGFMRRRKS